MSLINDALKRAESEKLVTISEDECVPEMSSAPDGPRARKRLLGPMTVIVLLLVGAGLVVYRFWGPSDGPVPQQATAGPKAPALKASPNVVKPAPRPKAEAPANPAFKNLTPESARRIRTQVLASLVDGLFSSGRAMNDYAASLGTRRRGRRDVKPVTAKTNDPPKTTDKSKAVDPPKPKPVLSAAAAGVKATSFRVSGIMFNGADSMAIINDGVYRIGQKVSGAVVVKITPATVILKIGDKQFSVGM